MITIVVLTIVSLILLVGVTIWLFERDHQREMQRIRRTHGAAALQAVTDARRRIAEYKGEGD